MKKKEIKQKGDSILNILITIILLNMTSILLGGLFIKFLKILSIICSILIIFLIFYLTKIGAEEKWE